MKQKEKREREVWTGAEKHKERSRGMEIHK